MTYSNSSNTIGNNLKMIEYLESHSTSLPKVAYSSKSNGFAGLVLALSLATSASTVPATRLTFDSAATTPKSIQAFSRLKPSQDSIEFISENSSDSFSEKEKTSRIIQSFLESDNIKNRGRASSETVLRAEEWLSELRIFAQKEQDWWCEPLVNLSISEEVVFEWWKEIKKLTVYVADHTVEFIKVWGPDIDNEMEEGSAESLEKLALIWNWLST